MWRVSLGEALTGVTLVPMCLVLGDYGGRPRAQSLARTVIRRKVRVSESILAKVASTRYPITIGILPA